jgi:hypothetical protein
MVCDFILEELRTGASAFIGPMVLIGSRAQLMPPCVSAARFVPAKRVQSSTARGASRTLFSKQRFDCERIAKAAYRLLCDVRRREGGTPPSSIVGAKIRMSYYLPRGAILPTRYRRAGVKLDESPRPMIKIFPLRQYQREEQAGKLLIDLDKRAMQQIHRRRAEKGEDLQIGLCLRRALNQHDDLRNRRDGCCLREGNWLLHR